MAMPGSGLPFVMTEPVLAIMQPTYLPWMGYMAMIDASETFVFLDTVQYDKRSWQQRNRVKAPNGSHWLTVPVLSKGVCCQKISAVMIDESRQFEKKHVATLKDVFEKTPFYSELEDRLFPILLSGHTKLADLNIAVIKELMSWLGINTKLLRATNLQDNEDKSERLTIIAEELGAGTYVAAPGSFDYLSRSTSFAGRGIDLRYLNFEHAVYLQRFGEFVSHLSVVDALCNFGAAKTIEMIRDGTSLVEAEFFEQLLSS
jgi:hypothetical protein